MEQIAAAERRPGQPGQADSGLPRGTTGTMVD